jgi:hypothetical protein
MEAISENVVCAKKYGGGPHGLGDIARFIINVGI